MSITISPARAPWAAARSAMPAPRFAKARKLCAAQWNGSIPMCRFDIDGNRHASVAIERQDLDEILGNLIENAAKYGGGSVFVTVDAEADSRLCVIWVEDDGMGIPPEQRHAIFDRGARLDTGKPGTGLGLAIVRDVAEIYGGGVELQESEDLGGLLVKLSLPRSGVAA